MAPVLWQPVRDHEHDRAVDRACSSAGARTSGSCARRSRAPRARDCVEHPRRAASRRPGAALARAGHRARSTPTRPRRSRAAWAGTTIVTTGTASGKSLCFNLPTLDVLCARPAGRARSTCTRPRRSRRTRRARCDGFGAEQARAPGDLRRRHAARGARRRSAASANVVLDQPRHAARRDPAPPRAPGASFFANLAVVVVDEAHVYRGVFGSHVANVLRRLRRIAAAYGTDAALPARHGDDRQPGRAGRAADRPRGRRAGRPRRLAGARAGRSRCGTRRSIDEALGTRRSRARRGGRAARAARARGRADDLLHEVAQGGRADRALSRATSSTARRSRSWRERVAPYRAGYTAAAAPRARGAADERRAARRRHDRRARAGDRHRRARRRRSCVTFPGHGRVAAPDVGPRRAPRHAASRSTSPARTRSTSSSAATPTSSSSARSRRRSSTTRPSRSTCAHLLCAAHEGPLDAGRRRDPRARAGARARRGARRRRASCASARRALRRCASREDYPAGERVAALGLARHVRDRRRRAAASCSATVEAARALSTVHDGRDLPAPGPHLRGARARPRQAPRARRAVRRRLVHAAQARDRHRDRAAARPPRGARRDA